ncbi:hypothetical protein Tco_0317498 [Tanacetum coccineum]
MLLTIIFKVLKKKVDEFLHDIVPQIASNATNDLIEDNLLSIVVDAVKREREASQAVVHGPISQEFVVHAPKIIEELFKIHIKNTIINVHPTTKLWDVLRSKFEKSSASTSFCRDDAFRKRDHDEHQGDDGPPEGEKSSKRQIHLKVQRLQEALHQNNQSRNPKILHQNVKININNKNRMHGLRIQLLMKMRIKATLRDMLSNQFRDAEEYTNHLKQLQNYIENQIVWESRHEELKHPKPNALVFYGP